MDGSEEYRWRRKRYPLHKAVEYPTTTIQQPLVPSAVTTAPEDVVPSPQIPHEDVKEESNGPAAWYHAVTSGPVTPVLPSIELALSSSLPSLYPTDETPLNDDSSTAVSFSHRSVSPSVHRESSSLLENTRAVAEESSQVQGLWSRKRYPLQFPTQTETERLSAPTTPHEHPTGLSSTSRERSEELVEVPSRSERNSIGKKTLRRSPRSRKIQLRAANSQGSYHEGSTTSSRSSSSSLDSVRTGDESTTLSTDSWKRQAYPSQSVSSNPKDRSAPSLHQEVGQQEKPPQVSSLPPPTRILKIQSPDTTKLASQPKHIDKIPPMSPSWQRRTYPLQFMTDNQANLPESPPLSDTETESPSKVDSQSQGEQEQTTSTKNVWQRRVYPLQSPASNANLRRSPTPPPSPKKEMKLHDQLPQEEPEAKVEFDSIVKKVHRKGYPLQSPASIPSFPTVQISPPDQPTEDDHAPTKESNSLLSPPREREIASKVINQWRRQMYPLHSSDRVEPFPRALTPQPPFLDDIRESEEIHLPKNIRAVKNSDDHGTKGRTIIVCLDGTGDKFDNDNSNIVHLISALKKDDPSQVSYYQAGIGTYNTTGLSWGFAAAADMAVGSGLGLHVRDAYHFLMHSYKEGDKICIFGFSRGAYTARCLAGMIHKVGLLPPRNIQQIDFAYEFYKKDTKEGWKESEDFKKTFCIDVSVYFLGCFDSVASVGFLPRQLPLSSTPFNRARYFRHAMALDERRAKFKVCRHQSKRLEDIEKSDSRGAAIVQSAESHMKDLLPNYKSQNDHPPDYAVHEKFGKHHHPNMTDKEYERLTGHEAPVETDVLEVWFAGAHADVGGGAVPNDERHKLAQIPLRWMIRQCFECNTGIIFKTKMLAEFGLDVHTLWPKYQRLNLPQHGPPPSYLEKFDQALPSRVIRRNKLVPIDKFEKGEHFYHLQSHEDEDWTPEQVEDFYDAVTPLNDQLIQAPTWWILEAWPVQYKVPKGNGEVILRTGMNLGRYRGVEDVEPNVHWTVLQRAHHLGYKIRVRTAAHTTWRAVV